MKQTNTDMENARLEEESDRAREIGVRKLDTSISICVGAGNLARNSVNISAEYRNHENQQHVHQYDGQTEHGGGIGEGRFHFLPQLDARFQISGHLVENFRERSGRFAGLDHRNEEGIKRARELLQRRRKGIAGGNIRADFADDDAKDRILHLFLKRLK